MPSVFLLKPGSIQRDGQGRILDARSSVTLIMSGRHRIIVDSGVSGEENKILKALADLGMGTEEIDLIVNTHSHPDHCGNNYLFSRARLLAPKEEDIIAPGVSIMATPGHSLDSISVAVEANVGAVNMKIIMAGDALPTFANFQKNVPPALHVDRALAEASMQRVVALADIVVPGHDFPFSIRKIAYTILPFRKGPQEQSAGNMLLD
jgi:glyoxylase-like metal-dependent hydrolase (beta-lactamase superfamily II)